MLLAMQLKHIFTEVDIFTVVTGCRKRCLLNLDRQMEPELQIRTKKSLHKRSAKATSRTASVQQLSCAPHGLRLK